MTTTYRLQLSTETRRLTSKKISEKKMNQLLKDASSDFSTWTSEQFGINSPDCVLIVMDADGFPIRSTTNGTDWNQMVSRPFFTVMR